MRLWIKRNGDNNQQAWRVKCRRSLEMASIPLDQLDGGRRPTASMSPSPSGNGAAISNPTEKLKGIRLNIAEYRRPDPKTAPRASKAAGFYMICTISKHAAEAKGYADAMMLDYRGQVTEATGANTFFIKDGVIHTPTPELLPERHHPPDGHRPRFTPSTISETLMNDDMKEVYPPAIAAG
ncbi:aminotransferase class IV [Rhizobium leguminosarum]|uniref:aminotransferase class IV n=1 Tax=Rhizobium leguminosarum TaxID=384 RepID=UPI0014426EBF|nr:aminotransferase class IV [Rhizobium leguminosarum]